MRRQRSGDLFPTDRPLPASQMIGREEDVKEVAASLMAGTNLVIAGPRRTGKTSVCEASLVLAEPRGFYTVRVDLFRVPTVALLAEAIVTSTITNRPPLRRLVHQARRAGRVVADVVGKAAVVTMKTELGDEVEIALRPGLADRDPERFLRYALDLPGRIAQVDQKPVIVFFDEFQEIVNPRKPFGDPDALTKQMRAIFQRSTDVSFLFAGSVEHLMRDLFAPSNRAFSQFGSFFELRPIDAEEWTAGLGERFEADECEIGDAAIARIIELGELHPRTTMLIAQKTHLTSIMLATRTISLELVEQGFQLALDGDSASNEQSVERIRQLHRLGLLIARRVALGEEPYRGVPDAEAYRALTALRRTGLVDRHGRGEWYVVNPLLRHYLVRLDPIEQ
jgi:hypothetical protein